MDSRQESSGELIISFGISAPLTALIYLIFPEVLYPALIYIGIFGITLWIVSEAGKKRKTASATPKNKAPEVVGYFGASILLTLLLILGAYAISLSIPIWVYLLFYVVVFGLAYWGDVYVRKEAPSKESNT